MLSPKSMRRFQKRLSKQALTLNENVLDSPRSSPKTPRRWSDIPKTDIIRVKKLASGASGCKLWKARVKGWSCCLKEISTFNASKSDVKEFENEIEILGKLGSQTHLVQFLGCQRTKQSLQIFMIHYEGNLNELLSFALSRKENWPQHQIIDYATQISKGVALLHKNNIIHRDIKSHNIFYTWTVHSSKLPNYLVLGDYGESKILAKDCFAKTCRGTPAWIAPEVFEANINKVSYTFAADVWSLGMVLYELMTRKIPYHEFTFLATFKNIQKHILPTFENFEKQHYSELMQIWNQKIMKWFPSKRCCASELVKILQHKERKTNDKERNEHTKHKTQIEAQIESSDIEEESTDSF